MSTPQGFENKTLGEIIRDARVGQDISLRSLAKKLGIAASYLSDIENDRRVPAADVIQDICQMLGLDFDDSMARAGRFGDEAERYLKRHPAAGMLLRKISNDKLREDELQKLLNEADRLKRARGDNQQT